ncbi:MAG: DUF5309 family protein [Chloroflexota bacterium]
MPAYGVLTRRVGGVPTAYGVPGFPADPHEVPLLNVRYVDELCVDLSDYKSLKLIKMVGGLDSFEYNREQIEWLEDDLYQRTAALTAALNTAPGAQVPLTALGIAHHYPRGTVLELVSPGGVGFSALGSRELVLVIAQLNANQLTVLRDFAGSVVQTGNYPIGTQFRVAGFAHAEDQAWTPIMTSMKAFEMNYGSIIAYSVESTFRNMGINRYGSGPGGDFSEQVAKALKRAVLSLEQGLLLGQRNVGTGAADPSMMGGLLQYIDAAFGGPLSAFIVQTNKAGIALTLADINNELMGIAQVVGEENAARTILCDYWGHRKINSFFEPSVRLAREENEVGLIVQRIDTIIGQVEIISDANMPPGQMLFVNPQHVEMGHLVGPYGRLMTGDTQPGAIGDRFSTWVYGDYSCKIKNTPTMGKIVDYSVTS